MVTEELESMEVQIIGWTRFFGEIELFMTELVERRDWANADYCACMYETYFDWLTYDEVHILYNYINQLEDF